MFFDFCAPKYVQSIYQGFAQSVNKHLKTLFSNISGASILKTFIFQQFLQNPGAHIHFTSIFHPFSNPHPFYIHDPLHFPSIFTSSFPPTKTSKNIEKMEGILIFLNFSIVLAKMMEKWKKWESPPFSLHFFEVFASFWWVGSWIWKWRENGCKMDVGSRVLKDLLENGCF